MRKITLTIIISLLLGINSLVDSDSEPSLSLIGAWEGPFAWPVIAVHACVLHTGKILHYSYPSGGSGSKANLWEPATNSFKDVSMNRNLFCGGHSFLPNGDVLITGGTLTSVPIFKGLKDAHLFHSEDETWERIGDMNHGRWYPTNLTLADGSVIVFGGLDENGDGNSEIEIHDPFNNPPDWTVLDSVNLPLYPTFHLLSDGKIFYSGPSQITGRYDPVTNLWDNIVDNNYGNRYRGTSVLLPGYQDRILIIGGQKNNETPPTQSVEMIDLTSAPSSTWNYTDSMNYPRQHANAIILPDATILVVGGRSDTESEILPPEPVYAADIIRLLFYCQTVEFCVQELMENLQPRFILPLICSRDPGRRFRNRIPKLNMGKISR
jgi:hypothetical protein